MMVSIFHHLLLLVVSSLLLIAGQCDAFAFFGMTHPALVVSKKMDATTSLSSATNGEAAADNDDSLPKRDLVNQDLFVHAVESLRRDMAGGVDPPKQDKELAYVLARTVVTLPIDTTPGLELGESESLVLVIGVTQETYDKSGIKPLDTIVSVKSANGFEKSTKELCIEDTAEILTEAVELALKNGETQIELELNRLMQGYYK